MYWDTKDGKQVCQACKKDEDLNCNIELVSWEELSPEEEARLEALNNEPPFDPDEAEIELEKDIELSRFVDTTPMGTDEDLIEIGILPDDNLVYMPFDRITEKDKKIIAKRDMNIEDND